MISLALYQPDIPGNTGTILRLAACLGIEAHVIEPAGFDLSDRALRRAGLDYLEKAALRRHLDWAAFQEWRQAAQRRLVLATTAAACTYTDLEYQEDDILLLGRESAGVPADVHDAADARIVIPMRPGTRSLNVAIAGAMVVGEALRQTSAAARHAELDGKA